MHANTSCPTEYNKHSLVCNQGRGKTATWSRPVQTAAVVLCQLARDQQAWQLHFHVLFPDSCFAVKEILNNVKKLPPASKSAIVGLQ